MTLCECYRQARNFPTQFPSSCRWALEAYTDIIGHFMYSSNTGLVRRGRERGARWRRVNPPPSGRTAPPILPEAPLVTRQLTRRGKIASLCLRYRDKSRPCAGSLRGWHTVHGTGKCDARNIGHALPGNRRSGVPARPAPAVSAAADVDSAQQSPGPGYVNVTRMQPA